MTIFREKVYAATCRIPSGKVVTYGTLGKMIDCKSSRAVGQALKHNPNAPQTPCHRVISVTRHLHGFEGKTDIPSLQKKRDLLEKEGITFDAQGRVHAWHVLEQTFCESHSGR